MSDREKTETFDIREIRDKKPQVNRSENDEYSIARRNAPVRVKENNNNTLAVIAIILAILLIAVLVAGIFILKPPASEEDIIMEEEEVVISEEKFSEEEEEEEDVIFSCGMVILYDGITKKGNYYIADTALIDDSGNHMGNKKLVIDEDTEIRENGKRLSLSAFVYIVENMSGESIVFDGEINNSQERINKITFERVPEEMNEEIPEEENTEEETSAEEAPEDETSEEEAEPAEPVVKETSEGEVIDGI